MSSEAFDPGTVINGKYRLIEMIGGGGMGQVWKAEDLRHDKRLVAVKFIAWHAPVDDREKRERFRQEMQALARLDHPHIVNLIEFDQTPDGTPFLVMNFIPGDSLQERLRRGEIDAATRRQVLGELCDALDYIHGQNVVHRDLKPSNILFDASGHVRISDFGLAKLVDTTFAVSVLAGTPGFEAPEQKAEVFMAQMERGEVPRIDHRADIYSLGVVTWLLFTGQHPDSTAVRSEELLSPELERVLQTAIARRPQDRYDSAGEFLEAVNSALATQREPALPAPGQSAPLGIWTVAGGLVLLVAIGTVFLLQRGSGDAPSNISTVTQVKLTATPSLPISTSIPPTERPTYTPYPTYTSAPTDTPQPSSPSPTATSMPTETPQSIPMPACPVVIGPFSNAWQSVRSVIGCAYGPVIKGTTAEEHFEGGIMLWREPVDQAQAVVLFDDGTWQIVAHSPYVEGSPEFSCPDANTPPQCPPTPKRGFGMIWCDRPDIRSRLGKAMDCERGYTGTMQQFERGFMLLNDNGVAYVFFDTGRWEYR